jgi:DNA primase
MGTALTVDQIKLLRGHISLVDGRDRIAVATDPDTAGWTSAQKAFWHLTTADLDPTLLELPDGVDPAKLFETQGTDAIAAAIKNRIPLGDAMIDHLLRTAGHWSDPAARQKIIEQAAQVLGARGPDSWPPAFERLRNRLHLSPGILEHKTLTESIDRDRNPLGYALARIDEINDQARAKAVRRASRPRRQPVEPAIVTAAMPIRPEHRMPPPGRDPAGPAR